MPSDQLVDTSPDDFKLLGTFYMNDFPLVVEREVDAVRILPPPKPWISLAVMTLVIACFFAGFVLVLIKTGAAADFNPGLWLLIAFSASLGTFGPIVAFSIRLNYLARESPLLEYCVGDGRISVGGRTRSFTSSDVVALAAVSLPNSEGEHMSELQLLVRSEGGMDSFLIATSLSGYAEQVYGKVVREFAAATGILTLHVCPRGWFKGAEVKVSVLTPEKRQAI